MSEVIWVDASRMSFDNSLTHKIRHLIRASKAAADLSEGMRLALKVNTAEEGYEYGLRPSLLRVVAEMVNAATKTRPVICDGLIQRRVALLDRSALGMDVVVFATINLTSTGRQNLIEFEREIVRHPEVTECYTMTGIWDYMLKIVTRDIRHYETFVRNTLTASPSIRELHTHMAVTEIKNTTELPLDTQL